MTVEPDEVLLERVRRGDRSALEAVLERYEHRIYRFGLRMCGHEEDAREVLQETLLSAYRHLGSFRGDAHLSTWLYQVARSFCIKQRRRREGEPTAFEALETAQAQRVENEVDEQAHAREVGTLLQAVINSLAEDAREALVLRDVEGVSAEAAAQIIGIEVGALKSRLHRARMTVKRHLADVLDEHAAPIACPELAAELSAYAASEIDQAACETIERHLAGCARCAAACDALKRTVSLCRSIPGGEIPAAVKASVRSAVRASQGLEAAL